ncbi:MAG: hypothetical protein E7016_00800 [Alphaproteobacteria bacterium]|nr:hypothetical protein [Alphaproteobacteria bacterium]
MRKYFLLSAVALMAASNVNAQVGELNVDARVSVADIIECTTLSFGEIVVKLNNQETTIRTFFDEDMQIGNDIISVSGEGKATCQLSSGSFIYGLSMNDVTLTAGENDSELTFSPVSESGSSAIIYGTLTIPANVESGHYVGSLTVTYVDE